MADCCSVAADEAEDGVVGGVAHGTAAEDEVVQSGVYAAHLGLRAESAPPLFDHGWRQHGVTRLELRGPLASVDFTGGVHHQHRNCQVPGRIPFGAILR